MNNKHRTSKNLQSKEVPLCPQNEKKMELMEKELLSAKKVTRRRSARERKLALLQDVDKLKKKLRHEENVHRALQRAFNRPLGALPRLPPYLPRCVLELLAEVAVLEEEVVFLEELVLNFRKGLNEEAVYTSSRKKVNNSADPCDDILSSRRRHSRSFSNIEVNLAPSLATAIPTPCFTRSSSTRKPESSDVDGTRYCLERPASVGQNAKKSNSLVEGMFGNENQSLPNWTKDKPSLANNMITERSPVRASPIKIEQMGKCADSLKLQCRVLDQAQESWSNSSDDRVEAETEANITSQDILKCLCTIFLRLSTSKGKTMDAESFTCLITENIRENTDFRDPYLISSEGRNRDIGLTKCSL